MGNSFRQTVAGIFSDSRMNASLMLEGHLSATIERAAAAPGHYLIAVQDSTYYNYTTHRQMQGLGSLQGNIKGIIQHNVLLLSEDGLPLGLVDQQYWSRKSRVGFEGTESEKWTRALHTTARHLSTCAKRTIMVQDREADIFSFFKEVDRHPDTDLLVRVHQPRRLEAVGSGDISNLEGFKDSLPVSGQMGVSIMRGGKNIRLTLSLQACKVHVLPDKGKSAARHKTAPLSLVIARETGATDETGQDVFNEKEAVQWYLLSGLPIDSAAQIEQIVYWYSLRWRIERFHYTLKSGALKVERLQFDDVESMINALSFYSVVGWQLLRLTYLLRSRREEAASSCFDSEELTVLEAWAEKPLKTVREAVLGMTKMIGFAPSAKQPMPGVKVLAQALERLYYLKLGYRLNQT